MVSVCVQTFNQAAYIAQCLDSVLEQKTTFHYEILLGDDSSTDGTAEICKNYARKFPDKIRLFQHQKQNNILVNGEFTGLFNSIYNFYSAKGKYLAYCDGDDYWTDSSKLQKQVDFLERHKDYVLAYHAAMFVDEHGFPLPDEDFVAKTCRDFSSEELQKAIVQPIISTWCFKNIVENIPEELTKTLNADNFWLSLLGRHGQGKFLPNILPSHYRIHKKGIWSLLEKEKQVNSKRTTYKNLSQYYFRNLNPELGKYFEYRSKNYTKMLIMYNLKDLNFIKVLKNSFILLKSGY
ncbi:glycosyltransferase family 2 protein [Salinimicrobium sp. HB62]|uniref:glycosyltransferase family 2 protein n=1 Tax=Salinimicrobium sp. HB62 TaxID=3077781 RepID=UPI002D7699D3|nr:glycosyltransferase [Salinimicrobium sp. HB62]